jgi:hypothetical protein
MWGDDRLEDVEDIEDVEDVEDGVEYYNSR